jgi:hypothetical protein
LFLRHQTMDKVQKHNSFNTNTPSSESYRNWISVLPVWKYELCINWLLPYVFQCNGLLSQHNIQPCSELLFSYTENEYQIKECDLGVVKVLTFMWMSHALTHVTSYHSLIQGSPFFSTFFSVSCPCSCSCSLRDCLCTSPRWKQSEKNVKLPEGYQTTSTSWVFYLN